MKAILVHRDMPVKRTHSIRDLNRELLTVGVATRLAEEDCELLDSIYVISKYPLDSVLPQSLPDLAVSRHCMELAKQTVALAADAVET